MKVPVPVMRGVVATLLKPVLGPPVPLRVQRAWLELLSASAPATSGVAREPTTAGGRPAERHVPADPRASVLLLHGGAFVTGSPRTHHVLAGRLAASSGASVVVPDYRLAPEHSYPAAVDDAVAAYDELAAGGPVAVVGDSAGGTLALLLARRRRPVALGLISPACDLTGASSRGYRGRDPLLRQSWVEAGVRDFARGADREALSPLLGDLTGLPPVLVHVSEHERLRPEGERLVERVREAGGAAELVVLPGLWHDAHTLAHVTGPADEAITAMGSWLRGHLRGHVLSA